MQAIVPVVQEVSLLPTEAVWATRAPQALENAPVIRTAADLSTAMPAVKAILPEQRDRAVWDEVEPPPLFPAADAACDASAEAEESFYPEAACDNDARAEEVPGHVWVDGLHTT